METENLIIVREPQASEKNGPYHIRLAKDFAVIGYNTASGFPGQVDGDIPKAALSETGSVQKRWGC
ncbi:hypothetical protein J2W43_003304 [Pseudomonas brassicacearum]|uniref:Uncharacterized protein n=1 Tax=Pseudomonas brassicacearum TaxID=930166 RepID=A0AAW8MDZ5_9PSED|nr:hypothetical protein [Pseudomonas brassicacearum]MDR6959307.1 hypothetical protein [Pseudomonas brassicacearum]